MARLTPPALALLRVDSEPEPLFPPRSRSCRCYRSRDTVPLKTVELTTMAGHDLRIRVDTYPLSHQFEEAIRALYTPVPHLYRSS